MPSPREPDVPDPRAEQLRERLAESRAAVEELERERTEDAETPIDEAVPPPAPDPEPDSVEERRRRVHERGRANARKMRKAAPPTADGDDS